MSCNKVCTRCPVVIYGREFITNFLLINNYDFDIILGMIGLVGCMQLLIVRRRAGCFEFLIN